MKTSSVEFISRSPNPLPMKSEHRRFVLLRKIFEPWQWKRRKKRNRFEQTSRTLQRKISMRSTKDQLKQCFPVEPSGCRRDSPLVSMEIPLRTAYGQNGRCGMQPKAKHSLRAQAHQSKSRTETEKAETLEKKLRIRERERRTREVREQALPSEYHRQTYL
ncbi:phosphatase and actin regulator 2 [Trichonephila clavipes]|nr:phosphatase and actin regulator 2 [Trichonephila clavipes]